MSDKNEMRRLMDLMKLGSETRAIQDAYDDIKTLSVMQLELMLMLEKRLQREYGIDISSDGKSNSTTRQAKQKTQGKSNITAQKPKAIRNAKVEKQTNPAPIIMQQPSPQDTSVAKTASDSFPNQQQRSF